MMFQLSVFSFAIICSFLIPVIIANTDTSMKCIDGPFHKNYSSREDSEYVECTPWKENTCCTANFTKELKMNQAKKLYNFDWHHCGNIKNLSENCERFIKEEECFYSCEPSLIKFWVGKGSAAVKGVPICADYCNRWFEACKNDLTCAENWQSGFNYTGGGYYCKSGSICQTFEKVYKNGEGLCNLMWGKSFKYETNSKNCMKMWFTGPNPNTHVKHVKADSGTQMLRSSMTLIWGILLPFIISGKK